MKKVIVFFALYVIMLLVANHFCGYSDATPGGTDWQDLQMTTDYGNRTTRGVEIGGGQGDTGSTLSATGSIFVDGVLQAILSIITWSDIYASGTVYADDANIADDIDVGDDLRVAGAISATETIDATGSITTQANMYASETYFYTADIGKVGLTCEHRATGAISCVGDIDGADIEGSTFTATNTINEFSTDGTMAGNSDDAIPTEKAVVTYVAAATAAIATTYLKLDASNDPVTGAIVFDSTIDATGTITSSANVVADVDLRGTDIYATGNVDVGGTLDVTGLTTLADLIASTTITVNAAGAQVFDVTAGGAVNATGAITTLSDINAVNADLSGDVELDDNNKAEWGGDESITFDGSDFTLTDQIADLEATNTFTVYAGGGQQFDVDASGNISASGTLTLGLDGVIAYIYGGDTAGDDLTIHANSSGIGYPKTLYSGGNGINQYVNTNDDYKILEQGTTFMTFNESGSTYDGDSTTTTGWTMDHDTTTGTGTHVFAAALTTGGTVLSASGTAGADRWCFVASADGATVFSIDCDGNVWASGAITGPGFAQTLDQVTTAGNTTTNAVTVGDLTASDTITLNAAGAQIFDIDASGNVTATGTITAAGGDLSGNLVMNNNDITGVDKITAVTVDLRDIYFDQGATNAQIDFHNPAGIYDMMGSNDTWSVATTGVVVFASATFATVTATTYYGDGSNLTGMPAATLDAVTTAGDTTTNAITVGTATIQSSVGYAYLELDATSNPAASDTIVASIDFRGLDDDLTELTYGCIQGIMLDSSGGAADGSTIIKAADGGTTEDFLEAAGDGGNGTIIAYKDFDMNGKDLESVNDADIDGIIDVEGGIQASDTVFIAAARDTGYTGTAALYVESSVNTAAIYASSTIAIGSGETVVFESNHVNATPESVNTLIVSHGFEHGLHIVNVDGGNEYPLYITDNNTTAHSGTAYIDNNGRAHGMYVEQKASAAAFYGIYVFNDATNGGGIIVDADNQSSNYDGIFVQKATGTAVAALHGQCIAGSAGCSALEVEQLDNVTTTDLITGSHAGSGDLIDLDGSAGAAFQVVNDGNIAVGGRTGIANESLFTNMAASGTITFDDTIEKRRMVMLTGVPGPANIPTDDFTCQVAAKKYTESDYLHYALTNPEDYESASMTIDIDIIQLDAGAGGDTYRFDCTYWCYNYDDNILTEAASATLSMPSTTQPNAQCDTDAYSFEIPYSAAGSNEYCSLKIERVAIAGTDADVGIIHIDQHYEAYKVAQ